MVPEVEHEHVGPFEVYKALLLPGPWLQETLIKPQTPNS